MERAKVMRDRGDPVDAFRALVGPGDEYFVSSMCVLQCSAKRFEEPVDNRANALQRSTGMLHIKVTVGVQEVTASALQCSVVAL